MSISKRVLNAVVVVFGFVILNGLVATANAEPQRIILDTDFGDDADDLAALALLHHFADLGEAEILAIGQANHIPNAPAAIDVINTYYNRPDIPIGQVKYNTWEGDQYSSFLANTYPELHDTVTADVPDVIDVYRQALVDAPDNSVNFVVIGFKQNMRDLLMSPADDISPLTGLELITQKVNLLTDMGGGFPSNSGEYNYIGGNGQFAGATKYYVENWPTPMVFSGLGSGQIKVGPLIRDEDTPVGTAMDLKLNGPYGGFDQAGFDLAPLLVAIRGTDDIFNVVSGCNNIGSNGSNSFTVGGNCDHQYTDANNQLVPYRDIGFMFELMLLEGPTSGDFDRDGDVDGNDFLHWQRQSGTTLTGSHLDLWQAQLGASDGASSGSAVPEPTTLGFVVFGLLAWATAGRRKLS